MKGHKNITNCPKNQKYINLYEHCNLAAYYRQYNSTKKKEGKDV
jgi:hypothetical protein